MNGCGTGASPASTRRIRNGGSVAAKRRGRADGGFTLAHALESLEARSMMAADLPEVVQVLWNGKSVEAVRDEFVLRMPQTNAATARSKLDYAYAAPSLPTGWVASDLGLGFFSLKAPGSAMAQVQGWAASQGVKTLEPNAVSHRSATSTTVVPAAAGIIAGGDPRFTDQWGLQKILYANTPNSGAWLRSTGSNNVVVAVLDDGVDYTHQDLQANMWSRPSSIPSSVIGQYGYDFANGDSNPLPDGSTHGTAVAGVIGAVGNNGLGISGVAQSVKMIAMKVGNSVISTAATVAAMAKLVQLKNVYGVNIVAANASYSRQGSPNTAEGQAIANLGVAGITLVAAAGNARLNIDPNPQVPASTSVYPAAYTNTNVITVAATRVDDVLAGYSNFGTTSVDIAAPGGSDAGGSSDILTTLPGNGYGYMSGTSMAAPFVTGTIALLKAVSPTATVQQVRNAILNGADVLQWLQPSVAGGRRLNADGAIQSLAPVPPPAPAPDPAPTFATGQAKGVLEGNSGQTSCEIVVTLDRAPGPGKSCSVWYETVPGTAMAGSDYVSQSGFVSFSGSETRKVIRLRVVGDRAIEPDEQFTVRLDPTKSKGATLTAAVTTNVSILDDDGTLNPTPPGGTDPLLPTVGVALKTQPDGNGGTVPVPIREGGQATFVVSLDKSYSKPVTVKYRTNAPVMRPAGTATPGLDYRDTSGAITFLPGETRKEFTVTTLADQLTEGDEQFQVVLSEPVNAVLGGGAANGGVGGAGIGGPSVLATILDVPSLPGPAAGFQIAVTFPDDSLTLAQRSAFQRAASTWARVIVGDLPNVVDPVTGVTVDDIWIVAAGPAIDGVGGILGQAGPTNFRDGAKGLPWKGQMQFDFFDLAQMEKNGTLNAVILHEMGHVLGFGGLWQRFGLLSNAGTANPTYIGLNARREYRTTFGLTSAPSVPVENTGAQGTYGAHWRESVFVNELMTGYAELPGVPMPLSRITVGAMQDLGYVVNYSGADPYSRPTAAMLAAVPVRPVAAGGLTALQSRLVSAQPADEVSRPAAVQTVSAVQAEGKSSRLSALTRSVFAALGGEAAADAAGVRSPRAGLGSAVRSPFAANTRS
jgi:subtilisin family serine protease